MADETQLGTLFVQARATVEAARTTLGETNGLTLGKTLEKMEQKRSLGRPPWKTFQALCKKTEKALL